MTSPISSPALAARLSGSTISIVTAYGSIYPVRGERETVERIERRGRRLLAFAFGGYGRCVGRGQCDLADPLVAGNRRVGRLRRRAWRRLVDRPVTIDAAVVAGHLAEVVVDLHVRQPNLFELDVAVVERVEHRPAIDPFADSASVRGDVLVRVASGSVSIASASLARASSLAVICRTIASKSSR